MRSLATRRPRGADDEFFEIDVPARLDRLPWSHFHWLVVTALGVTWILDGLEVTLVGSLSGAIANTPSMSLSSTAIGLAASSYLLGAVAGALFFGYLTDRLGRKRLFTLTVAVYGIATALTGSAWGFWSFALFRFATGAGIGGEYAAINSTIQELIPARYRGWTDLAINGSFWVGAGVGAAASLIALNTAGLPPELGWRLAFAIGGVLAFIALLLRRYLPESPRWLMTHGRPGEARGVVSGIERRIETATGYRLTAPTAAPLRLKHRSVPISTMLTTIFTHYRRRAALGAVLMASQAFLYNAIFFTYALVLTRFYDVPAAATGWYILPFALGNFVGPLLLGRLFDSVGRRPMIAATYAASGALMVLTGYLFHTGAFDATTQTAAWTVIFFIASAAASAAYLTVSESFPLEVRAIAIAVFYAFGTAIGGVAAPALFGWLIDTGSRTEVMWGDILGGVLMLAAAAVELLLGPAAERQPLESVATPLTAAE